VKPYAARLVGGYQVHMSICHSSLKTPAASMLLSAWLREISIWLPPPKATEEEDGEGFRPGRLVIPRCCQA
jgi:hypothetical protein